MLNKATKREMLSSQYNRIPNPEQVLVMTALVMNPGRVSYN